MKGVFVLSLVISIFLHGTSAYQTNLVMRSFPTDEEKRCLLTYPRPPQTIDHLIALIEKAEQQYPQFSPAELASRLLYTFRIDGLHLEKDDITSDPVAAISGEDQVKMAISNAFLSYSVSDVIPPNTYSQEERCTLVYLLSSSVEKRYFNDPRFGPVQNQMNNNMNNMNNNNNNNRFRRNAPGFNSNSQFRQAPQQGAPTVNTRQGYPQQQQQQQGVPPAVNSRQTYNPQQQYQQPQQTFQQQHPQQRYGSSNYPQMQQVNANQFSNIPISTQNTWTSDGQTYLAATGIIETGQGTVAPGPLLSGIAASNITRQMKAMSVIGTDVQGIFDAMGSRDGNIDVILASTLGLELAQDFIMTKGTRKPNPWYIGSGGNWTNMFCDSEYRLWYQPSTTLSPEIYGAMDGYLLGNYYNLQSTTQMSAIPRLSQALRSYYSTGLGQLQACRREINIQGVSILKDNVRLMSYVIYDLRPTGAVPADLDQYFNQFFINFTTNYTRTQHSNCPVPQASASFCNTKLDILVLMDASSGVDNFREQRNFISNLINRLDVYVNGSLVAVFANDSSAETDDVINWKQRPYGPISASTRVLSAGDLQCSIQRNPIATQTVGLDNMIKKAQKLTRDRKRNERTYKDANPPGKVLLIITNAATDAAVNAMKGYVYEQRDVTPIVLTRSPNSVKYLVRDPIRDVINARMTFSDSVDDVMARLCQCGSYLEFYDCRKTGPDRSSELSFPTYGFVEPNKFQVFSMTQMTMNSSDQVTYHVSTQYGRGTVCLTRGTPYDNSDARVCSDLSTNVADYWVKTPCPHGGYCPPVLLTMNNVQPNNGLCLDQGCRNIYQTKLTITHEGAYCNTAQISSSSLLLSLVLVTLTVIFKQAEL